MKIGNSKNINNTNLKIKSNVADLLKDSLLNAH